MKKCPRCGYENPDEAVFCEKCHYPLPITPPKLNKCPRCGYENPEGAMFCEKCHYPLFTIQPSNVVEQKQEEVIRRVTFSPTDYTLLLIGSVVVIIGLFFFFLFYPDYKLFYTVIYLAGTAVLTIPLMKMNKLYVLGVIGPFGLYFFTPTSLVAVLLISFGGVIVSTALRELYFNVQDNIVQISSLLLFAGYLLGMFFADLYMVTVSGYALLAIFSLQRVKANSPGK